MNKLRFVMVLANMLAIIGCSEGRLGVEHKGLIPVKTQEPAPKPDSLSRKSIDLDKSVVKWKGTKMLGTGSHEGIVKFSQGELLLSDGELAGGSFTVDMASIYITDIPLSDPVPRRNLTGHLNGDFEISMFPVATFNIIAVKPVGTTYQVTGALTIKGVTNTIHFGGHRSSLGKLLYCQFFLQQAPLGHRRKRKLAGTKIGGCRGVPRNKYLHPLVYPPLNGAVSFDLSAKRLFK